MSRRRPQRTGLDSQYTVVFVCTGFGSHPRRPLALWVMNLSPDGTLTAMSWGGTDITRPVRTGPTRTPTRTVNCRTCPAYRDYPDEHAFELAREAIGDGSRRTVD